jgi:hypothetical protein
MNEILSCTNICLQVKNALFLSGFNEILIFSPDFLKNFTKIRAVGIKLLLADGQTDMTKLIVVFRNFANAPKGDITG